MTPEAIRGSFRILTSPRVLRDRYLFGFGHAWLVIRDAIESGGPRYTMQLVRDWLQKPIPDQLSAEEAALGEGFIDGLLSTYEEGK